MVRNDHGEVGLRLANPNIGTVNDIICCPGADFCALANTTSLDVAEDLLSRFEVLDRLYGIERGQNQHFGLYERL